MVSMFLNIVHLHIYMYLEFMKPYIENIRTKATRNILLMNKLFGIFNFLN